MNTSWMDEQFVLSFYQTCLILLAQLLAGFACVAILSTLLYLCQDRVNSLARAIAGALELAFGGNFRATKP